MAEKRYYWIQLKEGFFKQKEIKKLRKIAGGDTYTVIYLKMLLAAVNQGNKLFFEGVEDTFPEELALELDEDPENVKITLGFLERQGLIQVVEKDEYFLPQSPLKPWAVFTVELALLLDAVGRLLPGLVLPSHL